MNDLATLMDILRTGGPYAMSAIFLMCWWHERRERRECEAHVRVMYEKMVMLVQASTQANARMQQALLGLRDMISMIGGKS